MSRETNTLYDTDSFNPTPYQDSFEFSEIWTRICIENNSHKWQFGFSSIQQLKNWTFDEVIRRKMKRIGYVIKVLEVKKYHVGIFQAVYDINTVESEVTMDITDVDAIFNLPANDVEPTIRLSI